MTPIADALAGQFWQLPPHSVESEMCVLASMVLNAEARGEVLSILRSDDFFQADHQIIFDAIAKRHRGGKRIDWHLVIEDLKDAQSLDEVGGVAYVAQIISSVPSAAHGVDYAVRVIETARLRALIATSNDALRQAFAPRGGETWELVARKLADDALSILNHGTRETIRHVRDVVAEAIERKTDGKPKRIPTGIDSLDLKFGGLPVGRTTIVGGRPGMGKSQFGKQVALNVARRNTPVGIVAIEEDRFKIADNLLSNQSGVDNHKIAYERYDQVEWSKVLAAMPALQSLPLYIDDERSDLAGIEGTVARMANKYGCRLIVVDYLQLIDPGEDRNRNGGNREQEVRRLSNRLKLAFKRLNVAGLVTAQLSRAGGTDPPQLHHLRESGAIEQDGDVIMLLHRADYYRPPNEAWTHQLDVNIAKNKDGPTAVVPLQFDGGDQSVTDKPGIQDPF